MPLRQDTDDRREITATVLETEDKCPDVIPGMCFYHYSYWISIKSNFQQKI